MDGRLMPLGRRPVNPSMVPSAIAAGRRIVGVPHDAGSFFIYYLAHDSHHRGPILLQAPLLGPPLSRGTMIGLWQWGAGGKEEGGHRRLLMAGIQNCRRVI